MPVTDEGQDQDQGRNNEQTRGFKRINLREMVMFTGRRFGLPFWPSGRHTHILTPCAMISLHFSGTRLTVTPYHRPKPGRVCALALRSGLCEAEFWF